MDTPFTIQAAEFFLGAPFEALRAFAREHRAKYADPLTLQTSLRRRFPDIPHELLSASTVQFFLQEGAERLGMSEGSLLHRSAMEQASSAVASRRHALLLGERGHILELCAGIGSDSVRLAETASHITCVERDTVTSMFLQHNLALAGHAETSTVLCADAETVLRDGLSADDLAADDVLQDVDAIFVDPSRRPGGRRRIDVEQYSPPLSLLRSVPEHIALLVKIAPAAEFPGADAASHGAWKRIFLAVGNSCPEQLLARNLHHLPALHDSDVCAMDAEHGACWVPSKQDLLQSGPAETTDLKWLLEPHPAIIRTGGVREYFAAQGAMPIDPQIAYGVSRAAPPASRWHASFRVRESFPFNRKKLREAVRAHDFGPGTEIKKRGFPLLPEQVRSMLDLRGSTPGVVLLTRRGDEHLAILADRAD